MNKPKNANELIKWSMANMPTLINRSSPIQDKYATKKMIEKNMRYIARHEGLNKLWATPEGQESILHAFGESLEHAATMPEMGSIVPFGSGAEFVASIECYTFALGNGTNAPLEDLNIVLVHKNDKTNITQNDGKFNIEMQYGIPRGEIMGVCVYATRKDTDKRIGEFYDVDRLIEKAIKHSPSYRNYVIEKEDFTRMEVAGELKLDPSGRRYMEKTMYKKGGGTWTKKIYATDLQNPYDGADRPEMLKKSAGKTFFRPFMKTRNASAMAEEWEDEDNSTIEKAADNVLDKAAGQFQCVDGCCYSRSIDQEYPRKCVKCGKTEIVDAEIVVEKEEKKEDDINNL